MKTVSIYIHYPYCLSKCHYCDFASFPCLNKVVEDLTDFYLADLERFHTITKDRTVHTIYFGGGTPSLMDIKTVNAVMEKIHTLWNVEVGAEITMEANPKTVTLEKLRDLKSAGINRVSLGIQSLNDNTLKFLGRIHNVVDALHSLDMIRDNFENVSADFIYAYPNQTFNDWKEELVKINSLNLPHLSLYELIIEENTKLHNMVQCGKVSPIDENIAADMFTFTNEFLKDTTPQYEISNYAKPGFESKHNINYWDGGDYIGIGPAAASRIKTDSFIINENPADILKWKENIKNNSWQTLTQTERAEELIIMGLRKTRGLNLNLFKNYIGNSFENFTNLEVIDSFISKGYMIKDGDYIKVSPSAQLILDTIIFEIIK